MEEQETTAEHMVLEALAILQRGLPGGDLDDREVITHLWSVFDNAGANGVYERILAQPKTLRSEKSD